MFKVNSLKVMNIILFMLELATLVYFIPLLIFLAQTSLGFPGIGFLVGLAVVIHYYIFKWYYSRGSLVFLGLSFIGGSLAAGFAWFSDAFKPVFFPAQYLFEYSKFYLPRSTEYGEVPLFYYYVFITGMGYLSIGKYMFLGIRKSLSIDSAKNNKTYKSKDM